ncbi:unnamed protein product [Schistosoma mattheei]|uniref:Uncharacterized protein n=1 Tax=Schistosoma mattheei TaxID=31246 RepID=A0A3P8A8Z6_9TREM|nr:unnamed protein product [Schistosoma mattheei]
MILTIRHPLLGIHTLLLSFRLSQLRILCLFFFWHFPSISLNHLK